MTKLRVHLSEEEMRTLTVLFEKGTYSTRTLTRARILLQRNKGFKYSDIESNLHVSNKLIYTICHRYCTKGLKSALEEEKRPGQPIKITPIIEAKVTALTCEDPPQGYDHWSSRLLKKELSCRFQIEISEVSIRRIWETHKLKPWKKKCGVSQK